MKTFKELFPFWGNWIDLGAGGSDFDSPILEHLRADLTTAPASAVPSTVVNAP